MTIDYDRPVCRLVEAAVMRFVALSGYDQKARWTDRSSPAEDEDFPRPGDLLSLLFEKTVAYADRSTVLRVEVHYGNLARGLYWFVVVADGDPVEYASWFEVVAGDGRLELGEIAGDIREYGPADLEGATVTELRWPDPPPPGGTIEALPGSVFRDAFALIEAKRKELVIDP